MNRREFLLGGLGLAATKTLFGAEPATDAQSLFANRGRYERLSLAYQHVHVGLEKPFSILHISDTHLASAYPHEPEVKQKLTQSRMRTFGGKQEEALAASLAWAKKNVDCVLHTGDLIDWQSEANFDLVRKFAGDIALGTMGNHEYSPSMWLSDPPQEPTDAFKALTAEKIAKAYPYDISFHAEVVNGVNFVMLDDVYGTVNAKQVERFAAEAKKGLPIVLCMHVPFFTDEIWRASCKFWDGDRTKRRYTSAVVPDPTGDYKRQLTDAVTKDFVAYLKSEKLLKAVLTGHLHITVQDRFSSTAMEYVVGGNFLFHGEEVLFS